VFLVEVVGELLAFPFVELFKHLLDLKQVISLVIQVIHVERFHDCLNFKANNVTQVNFGINQSFAAITRVMNHRQDPLPWGAVERATFRVNPAGCCHQGQHSYPNGNASWEASHSDA
jgi:hypothetical protein